MLTSGDFDCLGPMLKIIIGSLSEAGSLHLGADSLLFGDVFSFTMIHSSLARET